MFQHSSENISYLFHPISVGRSSCVCARALCICEFYVLYQPMQYIFLRYSGGFFPSRSVVLDLIQNFFVLLFQYIWNGIPECYWSRFDPTGINVIKSCVLQFCRIVHGVRADRFRGSKADQSIEKFVLIFSNMVFFRRKPRFFWREPRFLAKTTTFGKSCGFWREPRFLAKTAGFFGKNHNFFGLARFRPFPGLLARSRPFSEFPRGERLRTFLTFPAAWRASCDLAIKFRIILYQKVKKFEPLTDSELSQPFHF